MLEFLKRKKKTIANVLLTLVVLAAVSVACLLILVALNIINYNDGSLNFELDLFISFKESWYGWLVVILIQIVVSTLLCFIPGVALAFLVLIDALYPQDMQSFAISFIAVMLSSLIMYMIGKYGGYRLCEKILGEKDCKKAAELLNNKATGFFPIMMMFPMFPDEALVMLAGTFKMPLVWFIPSILIGRSIGIITYVFGFGNIPFDKFTIWDWFWFIPLCIIVVGGAFYGGHLINKHLEKKRNANKTEEATENVEVEMK